MRQRRITGHGLQAEGAAFDKDGARVRWNSVSGVGYARCACGEASQTPLPSAAARKTWHRDHKNDLIVEAYLRETD